MTPRSRAALAVLGLAALVGVAFGAWRTLSRPPLVVLIVLDTVRADRLPPWGAPTEAAPWIASFAERSVVFRNAFSTSSWTAPATASIFTGLYPPQHGVTEGFRAQHRAAGAEVDHGESTMDLQGMPLDAKTLPERFHDAGWRTLGVASNLNIGPELGFDRGFDRFKMDRDVHADKLTRGPRTWLEERDRPTLLYLHLNDAHHPYRGREPWYEPQQEPLADGLARYASEIRYLDKILAKVDDEVGLDDAIVVLVSDHGEAFGEHGDEGHIFSLYGEVNRVAMLVHAPGRVPAGTVVEANVSLVDVLPTLLDLAGLPPLEGGAGRSLVPLAKGDPTGFTDRVLFAHRSSPRKESTLWAAIRGGWKLQADLGEVASYELYDLAADPGETRPLPDPTVQGELNGQLDAFRAQPARSGPAVQVPVDDALYEHLEELGYVE